MSEYKKFLLKLEKLVNFLILPSVLILIITVFYEILVEEISDLEKLINDSIEVIIIIIFILDLMFKYNHLRNFPLFLKKFWLDIVVIFPFFLFFGSIEKLIVFLKLSETKAAAKVFDEGPSLEKEINKALKSSRKGVEAATRGSRAIPQLTKVTTRVGKIWPRILRTLKIVHHEQKHKKK